MKQLIQTIEQIRSKLEGFRRRSLKETPTRTIIIDPMLKDLGWDVRDLDEVELEYPPSFARDVSSIGHWGSGDLELGINNRSQIQETLILIRESFESLAG